MVYIFKRSEKHVNLLLITAVVWTSAASLGLVVNLLTLDTGFGVMGASFLTVALGWWARFFYAKRTPVLRMTSHEIAYFPGPLKAPQFASWHSVGDVLHVGKALHLTFDSAPPVRVNMPELPEKDRFDAATVAQELLHAAKAGTSAESLG